MPAKCCVSDVFGLGHAVRGDAAFRGLVLARLSEPASKQDSLRVLKKADVAIMS
jgi:hypothetical protein